LLFVDDGILMARPFDLSSLSFTGEPFSIAEDVTQTVDALWGGALFSVSNEGTLLFVRGAPERGSISVMRFFDREGNDLGALGEPGPFNSVRISHDGGRVATSIGDPGDIYIHDVQRGSATRFTFDPGNDTLPIWSPDDDHVLFQSSRIIEGEEFAPGNLFRKATSGLEPEEHLAAAVGSRAAVLPADWSSDGSVILLTALNTGSGADIVIYSFKDNSIEPFIATDSDEESARLSPDGRWLAYESRESGRSEVYVQAFPGPGGKWQLSKGGGTLPVWRADGKELFYLGDDGLMVVAVETDGGFRIDTPVSLFKADVTFVADGYHSYDVTPDGKRFLFLAPVEKAAGKTGSVTLVQGWRGLIE
jgi:WD40 repeat protein